LGAAAIDGDAAITAEDTIAVFDEVTGKCVGAVAIDRHIGKRRVFRTVVLFDERYRGSFDTHTECVAFVKGVEAVLNDILKTENATSVRTMLNHVLEVTVYERPAQPAT
jgi:hypothetical protein